MNNGPDPNTKHPVAGKKKAFFNGDNTWHIEDHSKAVELLAKRLPYPEQKRLEPYGSGDFCIAFKQGDQVIRMARHPEAASALQRETCVLAEIAALLPLPVPRLTYYPQSGCPPFTVHKEIVGEVLTREIWENMPVAEKEKAAADLAFFLRMLHSLPVEPALHCGVPQLDIAVVTRKLRKEIVGTIAQLFDRKTHRQLDQALDRWSRSSQLQAKERSLLHCDIGPGHVLYDPQTRKLTGVIDFADLAIGDPARDFIYICEDYGLGILKLVLQYYVGKDTSEMILAIRKWYLLEAISWTIQRYGEQRSIDIHHGLNEITHELATLATWDNVDGDS